jgi:hypothetical protein
MLYLYDSNSYDHLIFDRFYDERKPLEPAYHVVPVSKTASTYIKSESDSTELERLLHAPPG